MKWLVPAALTLAAAAALAARSNQARSNAGTVYLPDGWQEWTDDAPMQADAAPAWWDAPADEVDNRPSLLDDFMTKIDPRTYIPAAVPGDVAARNVRAFLDTIAMAEGTAGRGDNGYNILFGGATFNGYADHPRQAKQFRDRTGALLWTSAAGRYQAMAVSPLPGGRSTRVNTWDVVRARLGLPDFSPASQDAFAIDLIRERGALNDVHAGRFASAVSKVRSVWASLPGAGYNQRERSFGDLVQAYQAAGGTLET